MIDGYRWNSTIRAGGKPPNRRNEKRAERNFRRAHHSEERVLFVRSLPSVVSGKRPCVNVHIETGGMARKAHYTKIVPMTDAEHRLLHNIGRWEFERRFKLDLDAEAAKVEAGWISYSDTDPATVTTDDA